MWIILVKATHRVFPDSDSEQFTGYISDVTSSPYPFSADTRRGRIGLMRSTLVRNSSDALPVSFEDAVNYVSNLNERYQQASGMEIERIEILRK